MRSEGAHLLFVPDAAQPRVFLWGAQASSMSLAALGLTASERCVTEEGVAEDVNGIAIALHDALPALAAISVSEAQRLPASISIWSAAAKFALDLIARGRVIPTIENANDSTYARWRASILLGDDAERFAKLANSFPPAAHAIPSVPERRGKRTRRKLQATDALEHVWTPDALLELFLDACADMLMRTTGDTPIAARAPWEQRWRQALSAADATFVGEGFAERLLTDDLKTWIQPLAGMGGEARACFRLDLPEIDDGEAGEQAPFTLRYFLQSARDSSLLMPAADVYRGGASIRRGIASSARSAQEHLLAGLAIAGRLFPPIERSLHEARPESISMRSAIAWEFLNTAAPQLIEAGLGVILPSELTRTGQQRLRMRMRVGSRTASVASSDKVALTLNGMLDFSWQAELAGDTLSIEELQELAKLKAPLVRHRGKWVAVDRSEINEAIRLLEERGGQLAAHEGLAVAFGATERGGQTSLPIEVAVDGSFADVLTRLRAAPEANDFIVPDTFVGTLRPYQARGAGWLATMSELGLGACLADDMGLGKTVQLIALLLQRASADATGPSLLVCPTSVIGNWERELARFAPSLPFVRHYGVQRTREARMLAELPAGTLVLTTYGLLRRDWSMLADVDWSVVTLDEAQNIKNAASRTARAARALRAQFRVALTGTPIENRLAELWSIFEFLNPRFLGAQAEFRRAYAIPIERYGDADAAERLKRLTQPFILRRLKSDPTIIRDLPSKQEMKVICSLTREQASLYQAAMDAAFEKIEAADGIERRGQVLALLTALKQICNHPAQYLHEAGPLTGRSGKLQRIVEMLEEVVASGDRALVFTQYREMGERLIAELDRAFGLDVPFLHGGVAQAARDEMVRRFQEDAHSAPIFVLSVKAGGTGLNLTAANHVFHYDRWWNPAVEDQATDRAYRIGQQRTVQVHKLLCAGTVEDKIDQLLERKRELADTVVGAGEQWITELDDAELRDLFALAPDAVISEDIGESDELRSEAAPARKRRGREASV